MAGEAQRYNPFLGKKPELAWLPVDRLTVDPKYQRDTGTRRSKNLIEKIARDFLWSRFGVVLAVRDPKVGKGGGWFVIDGQHRVEAARLRGDVKTVPAVVLPHATVEAAAADFVAINRDRVAVTPLHIHHAQLAAGDPEAQAIDRACRAAGVTICRYPVPLSHLKAGQTLAVGTIARIVKQRGEAFATKVLKRVGALGNHEPGAYGAAAIRQGAEDLGLKPGNQAKVVNLSTGRKKRKCLSCERMFNSSGPGNRICNQCKGGRRD